MSVLLLDFLSVVFFFLAGVYAYKNYEKTKTLMVYWLVFLVAANTALAWSAVQLIEAASGDALDLDSLDDGFKLATATAFLITGLVTNSLLVKKIYYPKPSSSKRKNSRKKK